MNKHILFAMDLLENPSKYTKEDFKKNRDDAAYASAVAADDHANASSVTYAAASAEEDVFDAKNASKKCIDSFFKVTGEEKQGYLDEIKKGISKLIMVS